MMGVGPADAKALTFHQYTAMLAIWNARHAEKDGKRPVEPPDAERVRRSLAALNAG
ncbi:hypothetical protein [Sandarakinorhabdus sp. DWP1-3-1]|uniref:hypothetical protein n=1 Tax=Sandarakinorhabdus sp. DWP1-3-1 TaxID=2804627 RepID=UPI003CF1C34C